MISNYVTLERFEELTGYTVKAVERKIEGGAWAEGREYRRAPDGRRLVNLEGFHRWVEGSRPGATASR